MPPKLVRPQTFDLFKSPDSASPAVRIGIRTKYLFNLCPLGMDQSIALSAFPRSTELSAPLAICNQISSCLGFLFRLRHGWVNDQKYNTIFNYVNTIKGARIPLITESESLLRANAR